MKKLSLIFISVFVLVFFCSCSFAASKNEMQKMSVFLSNFTEVGLFNFDIENKYPDDDEIEEYQEPILHLGNPGNFSELVRFGIMHNFINNFKTRIKRAGEDEAAEYGTYKIEGKFVAESIKKYFGITIKNRSISDTEPSYYYDGKSYYFGAEGETKTYYAEVQGVTKRGQNLILAGDIYNKDNIQDRPAMFAAIVKPVKGSWTIISMTTEWHGDRW